MIERLPHSVHVLFQLADTLSQTRGLQPALASEARWDCKSAANSARLPEDAKSWERNNVQATEMFWTEEMCVGVEELDDDHKQLIALPNEANETLSSGQSREVVGEVLDRLVEKTTTHFAHEESLFDQTGFPGAVAHRREHDLMLGQALKWHAHFKSGLPPFLSEEQICSFQSWLDNHIQGADMQYGPHLNAKGNH